MRSGWPSPTRGSCRATGRRWGRACASGSIRPVRVGRRVEVAEASRARRIVWKAADGRRSIARSGWTWSPSVASTKDVGRGHPPVTASGGCCRRWSARGARRGRELRRTQGEARDGQVDGARDISRAIVRQVRASLDIGVTPRFAARMRIGELARDGRGLDRHRAFLRTLGLVAPGEPAGQRVPRVQAGRRRASAPDHRPAPAGPAAGGRGADRRLVSLRPLWRHDRGAASADRVTTRRDRRPDRRATGARRPPRRAARALERPRRSLAVLDGPVARPRMPWWAPPRADVPAVCP